MRHAILGGSGLVGQAIAAPLRDRGDEVLILTRRASAPDEVQWGEDGVHALDRLEGLTSLINLTGASIGEGRWTEARKQVLRDSRIESTQVVLHALQDLERPPMVYVGAGGVGVYGDRGDEVLDERSSPGEGFLPNLSADWEAAHHRAATVLGAKVTVLRKPMVLGREAPALRKAAQPFRLGAGAWLGDGSQYTPWVSLADAARAYIFSIDAGLEGTYNLCAPHTPANREWSKALGRALNRPVLLGVPRFALRLALGEMADDVLLASVRTEPVALLQAGFTFQDTDLEQTFQELLAPR